MNDIKLSISQLKLFHNYPIEVNMHKYVKYDIICFVNYIILI